MQLTGVLVTKSSFGRGRRLLLRDQPIGTYGSIVAALWGSGLMGMSLKRAGFSFYLTGAG